MDLDDLRDCISPCLSKDASDYFENLVIDRNQALLVATGLTDSLRELASQKKEADALIEALQKNYDIEMEQNEVLTSQNEELLECLRIAHMHALQSGYNTEDKDDLNRVRKALGSNSTI